MLLVSSLLLLLIITMIVDIVAKCKGYLPLLNSNDWLSFILKYTMDCEKRGYNCKGIGFWNEIFHFLCIISRILYLHSSSRIWFYIFLANLPMSVSYVWTNLAYSINILNVWSEEHKENEIVLRFI